MHKRRFSSAAVYSQNKARPRTASDPREGISSPGAMNVEATGRHITCTRKVYQQATVSVPLAIRPFSLAGKPRAYCSSIPVLQDVRCPGHGCRYDWGQGEKGFDGYDHDCGKTCDEVCYFVFSQEICIEVPVRFGALVQADPARIVCHEPSAVPCCEGETEACDEGEQGEDDIG